ncbi:TPA: GNAT family N-acetyltransferase [Elizabethkingia anophelis]|uniref:GNAT family N-acetyltransferase n=1 Tax=Elizabethkingia TaxID=308865 RepID=UPI001625F737|nr:MULTISPECIES: GNAT family N-acetyltransferase [Elizabethkingia]MCT3703471.1 GNAT family N-acetyltransferase [Elizabethkingia anophelis]MCT3735219.1 GNAT family N-acetyltransferase [Elizabethkingia anophelis]MCT3964160.1 GNAT family N-acetyltransferase [Elizabethkingia anophelis]MCT4213363.1 GNAT family N-acetyltransferase [Elizabethkingia anophelis]QQM26074.1 GNAT family N-acetyltransferase [Elizabethkingia sp. M8]
MEQISKFTYSDIKGELFRLKSKEMKTNFFMAENQFDQLLLENKIQLFKTEKACFLLADDDGFKRLYFIASAVEEIQSFFNNHLSEFDGDISIETAGNSGYLESIKDAFLQSGFYEYSSMVRMSKIRNNVEEINFENIHLLTVDKKEEFQMLYKKYFDKFVERIPTVEEIDGFIQEEKAYYFSDNDEIQGFIVFEYHGITSHLRYWFVHPDYREKKIGSKLIQLFFNIGEKVKRELFWVIESNKNAIKRYKHFGFIEEDMHNLILINKNKKYEEPNY